MPESKRAVTLPHVVEHIVLHKSTGARNVPTKAPHPSLPGGMPYTNCCSLLIAAKQQLVSPNRQVACRDARSVSGTTAAGSLNVFAGPNVPYSDRRCAFRVAIC